MKNEQENIDQKELKILKLFAKNLINYVDTELQSAIKAGELIEVKYE